MVPRPIVAGPCHIRTFAGIIAIAVGSSIAWIFKEELYALLLRPLQQAAPTAEMAQIHYKDLVEPFFIMLKTAIVGGVFLSLPVVLWQLWKFIAPGLYAHEKRMAMPFVISATAFFLLGSYFCYALVMPFGFEFLFKFSDNISTPTLMMEEHYGLALKMLLAFGAIFEMPVIAMFLSAIGVITHHTLIKHWRAAIVISFVFAAVLTPPDVGTQVAMAIPLTILYGISIVAAYFFTKRNERKRAEMMAELDKK